MNPYCPNPGFFALGEIEMSFPIIGFSGICHPPLIADAAESRWLSPIDPRDTLFVQVRIPFEAPRATKGIAAVARFIRVGVFIPRGLSPPPCPGAMLDRVGAV